MSACSGVRSPIPGIFTRRDGTDGHPRKQQPAKRMTVNQNKETVQHCFFISRDLVMSKTLVGFGREIGFLGKLIESSCCFLDKIIVGNLRVLSS